MSKWLASHSYLAEWVAALPVLWLALREMVRAVRVAVPTIALCMFVSTAIVLLRWSGHSEILKEIAKYLAIALILGFISEVLKQQSTDLTPAN